MKSNKHIEIVRSSKPGLSSMGKKSCAMIEAVLKTRYKHVGVSIVDNTSDLEVLASKNPDLVFLGIKKIPNLALDQEDVWASEFLDDKGVNYTGSTATAIALDYNKPEGKRVVGRAGLNTSSYFIANVGQYLSSSELPLSFPLFMKPPCTGGGKGIDANSVIRDFASFSERVDYISDNFQTGALVEEYLPGREFSVALLEDTERDNLIAMPIELITEQNNRGDRILGQSIKKADTEHVISLSSGKLRQAVTELAISTFKALGARDYGRIDIRLDQFGTPYFIEANLIPGLAFHDFTSYFTNACWKNLGMNYETMIMHIVELGLSRSYSAVDSLVDDDILSGAISPAFLKA